MLSGYAIARSGGGRARAAAATAFHRSAPICVAFIGILGLLHDAGVIGPAAAWTNIHALFGLALLVAVLEQFHWRMKHAASAPAADIDGISRHLSLHVYLLLYVLVGARQIITMSAYSWQGIAVKSQPPEALQGYLLYGVLALVTIRALAAALRYMAVQPVVPGVRRPPIDPHTRPTSARP
jgi:hypothetical protein